MLWQYLVEPDPKVSNIFFVVRDDVDGSDSPDHSDTRVRHIAGQSYCAGISFVSS